MAHLINSSIFLKYKIIFIKILYKFYLNSKTWLTNFIYKLVSWCIIFLITNFWIFIWSILVFIIVRLSNLPRAKILIHNSAFRMWFLVCFYNFIIFFSNAETTLLMVKLFWTRDFLLFLWRVINIIEVK
jgi:hypothetical protein